MAKLIDKYVIKAILVTAVIVMLLVGVLGKSDGLAASAKGTILFGTALGGTLGLIPGFFDAIKDGKAQVDKKFEPKSPPVAASKNN